MRLLAPRMLEDLVSADQRGFMPNRRISINIRKMLDVVENVKKTNKEALIVNCDFMKAFDTVNLESLYNALGFFDFPENLINWTRIIYTGFTVKVQNNGFFSEDIKIEQGLHQGGPNSSLYFLVIAEILSIVLKSNPDIKGIHVENILNLLNQFADDLDITSEAEENSIKAIFQSFDFVFHQTGLKINYDKTTIYRIGSLRFSNARMYTISNKEINWTNQDINVLGVDICHDNILEKNYLKFIDKSKAVCSSWANRGLSLIGRITVINSLIASLFVYKMMVLEFIPDRLIRTFENVITNFIWNGARPKISLRTLQKTKIEGGLKLIHLKYKEMALKASWINLLKKENKYAEFVYAQIHPLKELIWQTNIRPKDIKEIKIKSTFWAQVLTSWSTYASSFETIIDNQIIWLNTCIRIDNKMIFWKEAFENGLCYVWQLFDKQWLKSHYRLYTEFRLTTMQTNGLLSALPARWRSHFESLTLSQIMPLRPSKANIIENAKHAAADIYDRLIFILMDDDKIVQKRIKWDRDLNTVTPAQTFFKYFQNINKITNVNKFRSFQYRMLHRSIVTNKMLYIWKVVESPKCSFCKTEIETMIHLFVNCVKVQELWNHIKTVVEHRFRMRMELNAENLIMNTVHNNPSNIANFICLVVKQYIYRQRCHKKSLNVYEIESRILQLERLEKYIAIRNNKIKKHQIKWSSTFPEIK